MLNIVTIKNLLEDQGLAKVHFIKEEGTKLVFEYEVREDEYATVVIETEGAETEEDAVEFFKSSYVFVGEYEDGFMVETCVMTHCEGDVRADLDEVKNYKREKSAVVAGDKLAKDMNASFNGLVCMC